MILSKATILQLKYHQGLNMFTKCGRDCQIREMLPLRHKDTKMHEVYSALLCVTSRLCVLVANTSCNKKSRAENAARLIIPIKEITH